MNNSIDDNTIESSVKYSCKMKCIVFDTHVFSHLLNGNKLQQYHEASIVRTNHPKQVEAVQEFQPQVIVSSCPAD